MSEAEQIYFNPWDEAFRANPYPYYRPLMMGPPRLLNVFLPMALVARYADCAAVLRDHERFLQRAAALAVPRRADQRLRRRSARGVFRSAGPYAGCAGW